jgi:DNA-directed RNA polymerase specialized sigma24 family protein
MSRNQNTPDNNTVRAEHRARVATLYKKELFNLRDVAFRMLRNTAEAEDAVHDAFVRVLERNTPVEGDLGTFVRALVRAACRKRLHMRHVVYDLASALAEDRADD